MHIDTTSTYSTLLVIIQGAGIWEFFFFFGFYKQHFPSTIFSVFFLQNHLSLFMKVCVSRWSKGRTRVTCGGDCLWDCCDCCGSSGAWWGPSGDPGLHRLLARDRCQLLPRPPLQPPLQLRHSPFGSLGHCAVFGCSSWTSSAGSGTRSGVVTNSILFSRLFTIKDQTHIQGLR